MARPSVLITSIAAAGLLVSGVFLMMAPEGEEKSASKPSASAAPPSLTATPVESIAGPAEQPPSSPTSMAEIPQAPGARPAPPAPPNTLRGFKIWEGPDQAVASWYSERCGREVLRFGAQQYSKGPARVPLPPEMGPLDYSAGTQRLYGNRGAPGSLYVTSDGGSTFSEWLAVAESC